MIALLACTAQLLSIPKDSSLFPVGIPVIVGVTMMLGSLIFAINSCLMHWGWCQDVVQGALDRVSGWYGNIRARRDLLPTHQHHEPQP